MKIRDTTQVRHDMDTRMQHFKKKFKNTIRPEYVNKSL